MLIYRYLIGICFLALAAPAAFAEEKVEYFTADRLEQLVAPIALYPDALVAQVLMASTYPLQVTQAARWRRQHPNLQGDELDRAALGESWDPSVKSLLHFPDLLDRLNENLDWTRDLGDAVLAQQPAVMQAIQRMRHYAQACGNLQSNDKQRVVVEDQVIRVEPATEVVYVPSYNPTVVYGSYWAPASWYYPLFGYPYDYWYPIGYPVYGAVSFGLGVLAGAAIWGYCDWGYGWIGYHDHHHHWHDGGDIRVDRSLTINNYNYDGKGSTPVRWEHNPLNRRGVAYRDPETTKRYDAIRRDLLSRNRNGATGPVGAFGPRSAGGSANVAAPRGYDLLGKRSAVASSPDRTGAPVKPGGRGEAPAGRLAAPERGGPGTDRTAAPDRTDRPRAPQAASPTPRQPSYPQAGARPQQRGLPTQPEGSRPGVSQRGGWSSPPPSSRSMPRPQAAPGGAGVRAPAVPNYRPSSPGGFSAPQGGGPTGFPSPRGGGGGSPGRMPGGMR